MAPRSCMTFLLNMRLCNIPAVWSGRTSKLDSIWQVSWCCGQAYFLVVYDRESGRVVQFCDNKNEALLNLYLQHTPYFHAACMSQPWARYVTPCPTSLHLPDPNSPQSAPQGQVSPMPEA